jgi:plasmid replication initiation protein
VALLLTAYAEYKCLLLLRLLLLLLLLPPPLGISRPAKTRRAKRRHAPHNCAEVQGHWDRACGIFKVRVASARAWCADCSMAGPNAQVPLLGLKRGMPLAKSTQRKRPEAGHSMRATVSAAGTAIRVPSHQQAGSPTQVNTDVSLFVFTSCYVRASESARPGSPSFATWSAAGGISGGKTEGAYKTL